MPEEEEEEEETDVRNRVQSIVMVCTLQMGRVGSGRADPDSQIRGRDCLT